MRPDIQLLKNDLIHWLVELQDINTINHLKSIKEDFYASDTVASEMRRRAELSEQDIAFGRTISVELLSQELEQWKKQRSQSMQ